MMMNAAVLESSHVKPADRLGFTLLLAAILHVSLILGVGFSMPEVSHVSKSLEITLATFKSEKAPDKADFLAQAHQQGSGTLEHKAVPKTTERAAIQDTQVNPVIIPAENKTHTPPSPPKASIATQQPRPRSTPVNAAPKTPPEPARPIRHFDASQLSAEIASLEAEVAQKQQAYAKRPRIHRISAASTMRDKGAWYKEDWRKKIERIGNLNYPEQARRQGIYGQLRLLVAINSDGSLHEVRLLESSGHVILDEAAMRIVRLAAPFAPFTGDLADIDRLEIIRTWRFERGDRWSSR